MGSYRLVWTGKQYGKQARGGNFATFMLDDARWQFSGIRLTAD